QWSPDSRKLAFIGEDMVVRVHDLEKKKTTTIGKQLWMYEGELRGFNVAWSADSRWLAYAQDLDNRNSGIVLHDLKSGKGQPVTSGFYNDDQPTFDPDGKYLYYRSGRTFEPVYSDL